MQFSKILPNLLWILGILFLTSTACVDKDENPSDPSAVFAKAREPYDDELYEIAITRLGEFKSRFPYNKHALEAELMIANSHFNLGQFAEAAAAYEQFVKLHPRHPEADFAQFRVGESYWTEAPDDIDREQEYTLKAVTEWEKLVTSYPQSTHRPKAEDFIKQGKRRVADHYEFIAAFYCKREIYPACAYRYIELAELYPQFKDLQKKAFEKASLAFSEMSKQKSKDEQSDANLYFKSMSSAQLQQKSEELKALAAKISL